MVFVLARRVYLVPRQLVRKQLPNDVSPAASALIQCRGSESSLLISLERYEERMALAQVIAVLVLLAELTATVLHRRLAPKFALIERPRLQQLLSALVGTRIECCGFIWWTTAQFSPKFRCCRHRRWCSSRRQQLALRSWPITQARRTAAVTSTPVVLKNIPILAHVKVSRVSHMFSKSQK